MDRRQALKGMAASIAAVGGAAVVMGSPAIARSERADRQWDLIVIGGGFAGVTAARDASLRGLSTLLLEARPRLGGRTHVAEFAGHRIEVGGTWIGPGQPHVWAERMRYGLPLAESAAAGATRYVWYGEGKRHEGGPDSYWAIMNPAYDAFYAPAREAMPRPYDPLFVPGIERLDRMTAAEAIDALKLDPTQIALLHSFAGINGHSYSRRSSYLDQLRWIALGGNSKDFMWDNLSRFRFANGTAGLIDHMVRDSRAEIRLDAQVARIWQGKDGVRVTTHAGETIAARAAIVALPLNVLAGIEFQPGLSAAKVAASKRRHTGSGTKVYAKVAGKHPVLFANGTQDMPLNFLWTEYDDADSQLLVGFGASPELLDVTDRAAVEVAIRAFVPDARVLEVHSHDWNGDPYSLGTWCMYPPGMLTESLTELQRPEGNLFFAGADIASGWRGFIDGAIESGAAAAIKAAAHLKRS